MNIKDCGGNKRGSTNKKKTSRRLISRGLRDDFLCLSGADGTRTRDPMRDRHVF